MNLHESITKYQQAVFIRVVVKQKECKQKGHFIRKINFVDDIKLG